MEVMADVVRSAPPTRAPPQHTAAGAGRFERGLVEDLGADVYETAVTHGWIDENDPSFPPGSERRAVLHLLTDLGLLRFDDHARRYHPVDPSAASDQLVVPLAQQ